MLLLLHKLSPTKAWRRAVDFTLWEACHGLGWVKDVVTCQRAELGMCFCLSSNASSCSSLIDHPASWTVELVRLTMCFVKKCGVFFDSLVFFPRTSSSFPSPGLSKQSDRYFWHSERGGSGSCLIVGSCSYGYTRCYKYCNVTEFPGVLWKPLQKALSWEPLLQTHCLNWVQKLYLRGNNWIHLSAWPINRN